MLWQGQVICERCGAVAEARDIRVEARDDYACPSCGSLRLKPLPQRHEGVRSFLLDYNHL